MEKPRIFLGSSGKQAKLLKELTRGLEDVARVEPWMTSFNPGVTTLERLIELTRDVDFDDVRDIQRTLKNRGLALTSEADESSTAPQAALWSIRMAIRS